MVVWDVLCFKTSSKLHVYQWHHPCELREVVLFYAKAEQVCFSVFTSSNYFAMTPGNGDPSSGSRHLEEQKPKPPFFLTSLALTAACV